MNLSIAGYSYQYLVRKIDKKKKKKHKDSTYFLSLILITFNFFFFISLIVFLLDLNKFSNIFNTGLPLGPIATALAFIFFTLYYLIAKPKYNAEVINKMKKAYHNTKQISKRWVIIYLIVSVALFLISFEIFSWST